MEVADAFWDNFHDGIIKKKEAKWRYERYRFQAQPSSPAAKAAMALKLRNAHASSSSGKVNKGEIRVVDTWKEANPGGTAAAAERKASISGGPNSAATAGGRNVHKFMHTNTEVFKDIEDDDEDQCEV